MSRLASVSATCVKMLLGALYCFSAAAKYIALEKFELYTYSFGFFSQTTCFIVARLILAGELLLGALLLSNRFHKLASLSNTLLLLGFTLFLGYATISGRTDNCNCFGDMLQFDPTESILKNAFLLLLTFFSWRYADTSWRPQWWLAVLMPLLPFETIIGLGHLGVVHMIVMERDLMYVAIGCMSAIGLLSSLLLWPKDGADGLALARRRWWILTPIILAPFATMAAISTSPEDWNQGSFKYPFDKDVLQYQLHPGGLLEDCRTFDSRRVVAFYSIHCSHCHETAIRVNAVKEHNNLPDSCFVNVFGVNDPADIDFFYQKTQTPRLPDIALDPEIFVQITKYQFPLVLLVDGDSIYASFGGAVPEKQLLDFLNNK